MRRDIAAAIRRHRPELIVPLNHRDTWGGADGGGFWNPPDHKAVGRAVLDAAGDAGNRWIFPELISVQGLEPWNGVRWVAVAGSATPTHAVDATAGLERSIASLLEHKAYIEVLTDQDPEEYGRTFLTGNAQQASARFGGRPALPFELFPR
ncbi:hypothetical protein ADK55_15355 [Streptomyces sp. WM4235]|nr:hypothetical protein ADK55_15355 [Streptomyces sp. WM4235]